MARKRTVKRSMKRSRGQRMKRSMKRSRGRRGGQVFQPEVVKSEVVTVQNGVQPEVVKSEVVTVQDGVPPEEEDTDYVEQAQDFFGSAGEKTTELLGQGESKLTDFGNSAQVAAETKVDEGKKWLSGLFGSSEPEPMTGVPKPVTGVPKPVTVVPEPETKEKAWYELFGGKRRSRQMMGGRTLDFGYDAAPVTDMNVAQPTYMMTKGGKRRCTCKKRRKYCKKSCRKHHRHHRR